MIRIYRSSTDNQINNRVMLDYIIKMNDKTLNFAFKCQRFSYFIGPFPFPFTLPLVYFFCPVPCPCKSVTEC